MGSKNSKTGQDLKFGSQPKPFVVLDSYISQLIFVRAFNESKTFVRFAAKPSLAL